MIVSLDYGIIDRLRDTFTDSVIVDDTILLDVALKQICKMTEFHKLMCVCEYCNTSISRKKKWSLIILVISKYMMPPHVDIIL